VRAGEGAAEIAALPPPYGICALRAEAWPAQLRCATLFLLRSALANRRMAEKAQRKALPAENLPYLHGYAKGFLLVYDLCFPNHASRNSTQARSLAELARRSG